MENDGDELGQLRAEVAAMKDQLKRAEEAAPNSVKFSTSAAAFQTLLALDLEPATPATRL